MHIARATFDDLQHKHQPAESYALLHCLSALAGALSRLPECQQILRRRDKRLKNVKQSLHGARKSLWSLARSKLGEITKQNTGSTVQLRTYQERFFVATARAHMNSPRPRQPFILLSGRRKLPIASRLVQLRLRMTRREESNASKSPLAPRGYPLTAPVGFLYWEFENSLVVLFIDLLGAKMDPFATVSTSCHLC